MKHLNISVLLLFAVAALHISETDVIKGSCNDDIKLPCKAFKRTPNYRFFIWYNMAPGNVTAIIKYKDGEIAYKNNQTTAFLGKDGALEFHNVQPSHSGQYKCFLGAAIGGQNDESFVELNISECHMSTAYPSITGSLDSCPEVEEITVSWAVVGLSILSMGKIILCIVTVGVCDRVIFKTTRRKQDARGSVTRATGKNLDSQKR